MTEIPITEIQKCKFQKYRNTKYRSAETQIKILQKYKLNKNSPILQKSPEIYWLNMNYWWIWIKGVIYV